MGYTLNWPEIEIMITMDAHARPHHWPKVPQSLSVPGQQWHDVTWSVPSDKKLLRAMKEESVRLPLDTYPFLRVKTLPFWIYARVTSRHWGTNQNASRRLMGKKTVFNPRSFFSSREIQSFALSERTLRPTPCMVVGTRRTHRSMTF